MVQSSSVDAIAASAGVASAVAPPVVAPPVVAEGTPYRSHVKALDGVRGLAVLAVMASHLFSGNPHGPISWFMLKACQFGSYGVDLFFVLSGFLITGILYDSLSEGKYFKKFYARRALRIFPLYYGVLAVFGILTLVMHRHNGQQLLSLSLYLQNTSIVGPPTWAWPDSYWPLGHFWSLAIEEQFYLVWPLVVFLLATRKRVLAACIAGGAFSFVLRGVMVRHGVPYDPVHVLTVARLDTLLSGGALAMLLRGPGHDRILRRGRWLFPLGSLVTLVVFNIWNLGYYSLTVLCLSWAMAMTGLLTWSLNPGSVAQRFFELPMLRTFGKYSYGLYVFHMILDVYLGFRLHEWMVLQAHVSPAVAVPVSGVLIGLLSFGVALLSYHLYEKQFLKLKKYFDYRRTSPA